MSKNQNTEYGARPEKKRHSLWWLWLILVLAAFAGGIIMGLKLNTMPLPTEVKDKLYPMLESLIPGGTTPSTPAAAVTPYPSAKPEETPAPAEIPAPMETAAPAETPAPLETAAPAETPAPLIEAEPTPAPVPAASEAPAIVPAEETPAAKSIMNESLSLSETATFASNAPSPASYIGVDAALQIALAHAEVSEKDAEVSAVNRTRDEDGTPVYKVSFQVGEQRYDYVIDAQSGEILSWILSGLSYSDTATFAANFTGNDRSEAQLAAGSKELIGEKQAKDIAFAHAAVKEADVLRASVKLVESADGAVYHVDFRITDRSFEYQIDAATGEILGIELR